MKYLLIKNFGYKGLDFGSFASEKNKDELIKEFDILWNNSEWGDKIRFYNILIDRFVCRESYTIETLNEFWETSIPKN